MSRKSPTVDTSDLKILEALQEDGRMSNADISRKVDLAPSATLDRLRKLENRGVIQGYETRLDANRLGLGLLAFVAVQTRTCSAGDSAVLERLGNNPHILEIHHVTGEDCYWLKVRARNPEDLSRILQEEIGVMEEIQGTRTTIVLRTLKESIALPLG